MKDDKVACTKERGQCDGNPKPRKKVPIPPLPVDLPPIDLVHRDILRAWGQKLRLSTKGPKIDLYKRLCEYAYPHQKPCLQTIPNTAKEVKIKTSLQIKSKVGKEEMSLGSAKKTVCSVGTDPPVVAPTLQEGVAVVVAAISGVN